SAKTSTAIPTTAPNTKVTSAMDPPAYLTEMDCLGAYWLGEASVTAPAWVLVMTIVAEALEAGARRQSRRVGRRASTGHAPSPASIGRRQGRSHGRSRASAGYHG